MSIANFQAWLAQPFNSNMSAFRWFLFFGLLILIMAAWKLVLGSLEDAT